MDKDLNKIIEDSKKDFAKDTFKTILKNWGINFSKLPPKERLDTLTGILQLANIRLAQDPAGGLAIKIMEQRRRDNDTQERIRFAQAYNLATEIVSAWLPIYGGELNEERIQNEVEKWQKYFYQKLNNNEGEN